MVINTDIYGSLSLSLSWYENEKNFIFCARYSDLFYNTTVMIWRGPITLHNERARASQVELLIFLRRPVFLANQHKRVFKDANGA